MHLGPDRRQYGGNLVAMTLPGDLCTDGVTRSENSQGNARAVPGFPERVGLFPEQVADAGRSSSG